MRQSISPYPALVVVRHDHLLVDPPTRVRAALLADRSDHIRNAAPIRVARLQPHHAIAVPGTTFLHPLSRRSCLGNATDSRRVRCRPIHRHVPATA